jgi:hypothetical protein
MNEPLIGQVIEATAVALIVACTLDPESSNPVDIVQRAHGAVLAAMEKALLLQDAEWQDDEKAGTP